MSETHNPASPADAGVHGLSVLKRGMAFYVYIVTNKRNGTLYIGHTDDIANRIWQHKTKAFGGFTQKYGCDRLVWLADFPTRDEAKVRERQMKAWKRDWKIEEIEKLNPGWHDLSLDFGPTIV